MSILTTYGTSPIKKQVDVLDDIAADSAKKRAKRANESVEKVLTANKKTRKGK